MTRIETVPVQIAAFAERVRAELSDLTDEEIEELTEGLDADLAEAYAEDLARELPDPATYAEELRTAAGLPMRRSGRPGRWRTLRRGVAEFGDDLRDVARRHRAVSATWDVLMSLRPAWWLVRGLVAAYVLLYLAGALHFGWLPPVTFATVAVSIICVVASVALGASRRPPWAGGLLLAANLAAVWFLVGILSSLSDPMFVEPPQYVSYEPERAGVMLDGAEVTNIFAYDAEGNPLTGVQLFDQDGQPLATSVDGGNGCLEEGDAVLEQCTPGAWLPSRLETGAEAWNVYPAQMAESTPDEPWRPQAGAAALERTPPFVKVPALAAEEDE